VIPSTSIDHWKFQAGLRLAEEAPFCNWKSNAIAPVHLFWHEGRVACWQQHRQQTTSKQWPK